MLTDGLELLGNSTASNFAVASGTVFPVLATFGEMFYKTGDGLYVYTDEGWIAVGESQVIDAEAIETALGYEPAALDNGKLVSSQIPAIAITDTFVVPSQVGMLAIDAEVGDVAVRTDLNKTFILKTADATVLANWQELLSPTSSVVSVNGQTGTIVLTTSNITEGTNLYFTNARARSAISVSGAGGSYDSGTGVISIAAPAYSNFTLMNGAGATGEVQYNASGVLTSSAKFKWTDSTNTLTFGTTGALNGKITLPQNTASGEASGNLTINSGDGTATSTNGGTLTVEAGSGYVSGGYLYLNGGATNSASGAGTGGNVVIRGGQGQATVGGAIQFQTHVGSLSGYLDRLVITNTGEWKLFGSTGTSGQVLTSKGAGTTPLWSPVPYDIASGIIGKPAASAVVLRFIANRAFTIPVALAGTTATASTVSTGAVALTLLKNGSSFGTINFAAGTSASTLTSASGATFASGDVLTITAPASADATFADVQFTIAATLT